MSRLLLAVAAAILLLLPLLPVVPGAAAERARTVVVFIPGLASELTAQRVDELVEECDSPGADEVFGHLKERLVDAHGFECADFLNYSYDGSGAARVERSRFYPPPYTAAQTGRAIDAHSAPSLERWLERYEDELGEERLEFVLVGHSTGGVVALEYARQVAETRRERGDGTTPNVVAVVAVDSPLLGLSDGDRAALVRRLRAGDASAQAIQQAVGDLPSLLDDSEIAAMLSRRWRADWSPTAERLADQGIVVYSTGNRLDCLWNPGACDIPREVGLSARRGQARLQAASWDASDRDIQRLPNSDGPKPLPKVGGSRCDAWPAAAEAPTVEHLRCIRDSQLALLRDESGNDVEELARWIKDVERSPDPEPEPDGDDATVDPPVRSTRSRSVSVTSPSFGPVSRLQRLAPSAHSGSYGAAMSSDGRFLAFTSDSSALDPRDANDTWDIFVRDRQRDTIERVSLGADGAEGGPQQWSDHPAISDDGRYVAFVSIAAFVPGDANEASDIFVKDRQTGAVERVSVGQGGAESNERSLDPAISADGRYVAFVSHASNLVAGDTNAAADVFVRDRRSGSTERISVAPDGAQGTPGQWSDGAAISADGRYVAFASFASGLVDDDTNDASDVFVKDRQTGAIERVSVAANGAQGASSSFSPSLSADGRYVAFASESRLTPKAPGETSDIFVKDRRTGAVEQLNVGPDGAVVAPRAYNPAISGDGRVAAFVAENDSGGYEVYVKNRRESIVEQVGRLVEVEPGDPHRPGVPSDALRLSVDGRYLAFTSEVGGLAADDTNGTADVYILDLTAR